MSALDEQSEAVMAIIKRVMPSLMEHCDSVQVIATKFDHNGLTHKFVYGEGNFYARLAACREWVQEDAVRVQVHVSREYEREKGDDDGG